MFGEENVYLAHLHQSSPHQCRLLVEMCVFTLPSSLTIRFIILFLELEAALKTYSTGKFTVVIGL